MALTDADRLQIVAMALMRHSVVGGGGGGTPTGDYTVRFIDYDGTILKTQLVVSGESATPPTEPDHTDIGLTFQEWNYTSAQLSSITSDLDVGAIYTTSDGRTRYDILLTTQSGLSVTVNFIKSDTSTLTIDWGDGDTSVTSLSGGRSATHTYTEIGAYSIFLSITSGSGTFIIGRGTNTVQAVTPTWTLKAAYIGDGVTELSKNVFNGCDSLSRVSIPRSVESLGTYTFYTCYGLIAANVPKGITSIGTNAFYKCHSIQRISMPSGITTLGNYFINNCESLNTIILPPGAILPMYGVQGCSSLTSFSIPFGNTEIPSYCFNACPALRNVAIPEGVESIGDYAFQNALSLPIIDLPSTITSVKNYAFRYCKTTLIYIFRATTPPTLGGTSVFQSINTICKIYVPDASVDAYKAATYWSALANYIYPLSEYVG